MRTPAPLNQPACHRGVPTGVSREKAWGQSRPGSLRREDQRKGSLCFREVHSILFNTHSVRPSDTQRWGDPGRSPPAHHPLVRPQLPPKPPRLPRHLPPRPPGPRLRLRAANPRALRLPGLPAPAGDGGQSQTLLSRDLQHPVEPKEMPGTRREHLPGVALQPRRSHLMPKEPLVQPDLTHVRRSSSLGLTRAGPGADSCPPWRARTSHG